MDINSLVQTLTATVSIDAAERKNAEARLNEVQKVIDFVPTLLEIVIRNDFEFAVRQAAAIYMANIIASSWLERNVSATQPLEFSIHEQDRSVVRAKIVEALIQSPEKLRLQLAKCIYNIIKCDFPSRWPQIVDQIRCLFNYQDLNRCSGTLLCLRQLIKNYEYKNADERTPITKAMQILLPKVCGLLNHLLSIEQNEECVLLQSEGLITFHDMAKSCLPFHLITNDVLTQWMQICCRVIGSPVLDSSELNEGQRLEARRWLAKQWALHIGCRILDRYACSSPADVVNMEYEKFAKCCLINFDENILKSLRNALDHCRNNVYMSPSVVTEIIHYIDTSVSHWYTWKLIKPYTFDIILDVLFIQQYEADVGLPEIPKGYIRTKYDMDDDSSTFFPSGWESLLLLASCKPRTGISEKLMQFLLRCLATPKYDQNQKEWALRMGLIGATANVLMYKKDYCDQIEEMIIRYIFPEFNNPHRSIRSLAFSVLRKFCEFEFKNPAVLVKVMRLAIDALSNDKCLAVKVEAAFVLEDYYSAQEIVVELLEQEIGDIAMKLLKAIIKTGSNELTDVMLKILVKFYKELQPLVVKICKQLAATFMCVLSLEKGADQQAFIGMRRNTLHIMNHIIREYSCAKNTKIVTKLQPIVYDVILYILNNNIVEFYPKAFQLVFSLTSNSISPEMWQMLEHIYTCIKNNGIDHFRELMPALHNYVIVDTPNFLASEQHVRIIFEMCKMVLTTRGDAGEKLKLHAVKLMEVIILQCKGQIDNVVPSCVELVLVCLMKGVKSSKLRTTCLQVLIAALYYNPTLLFQILNDFQVRLHPTGGEQLLSHFIKQWLDETNCFAAIHDRKLYVLGLCTAISLRENKPAVLNELAEKILPSLLKIFDGLKCAYQSRDGGIDFDETWETNVTPIDNEKSENPIDEYIIFCEVMQNMALHDPQYYALLMNRLNAEQTKQLKSVGVVAEQKRAMYTARAIERHGGYAFRQQTVPTSFNFS